jgi:hypothetical protein
MFGELRNGAKTKAGPLEAEQLSFRSAVNLDHLENDTCEPVTLLNRHFSDSDGGADRTVGKLGVMRVWWFCNSDFTGFK